MDKGSIFFGTSVFGQLISLIDDRIIRKSVQKCNSDYYVKRFKTKDHLISMLFCVLAKCVSLREVSGAMLGLSGKTKHFRLESLPYRSTLSDANKRRDSSVFEQIYYSLLQEYKWVISDSRFKDVINKQVEIFDTTVLTLFQEVLKSVGRNPTNGKKKGGIKMHTIINVDEMVPKLVWFTSAATNDRFLLNKLELSPDKIYVFDKGYDDYRAFDRFCESGTGFVTRIKDSAVYQTLENNEIESHIHSGVLEDKVIELTVKQENGEKKLKLRKIRFYDRLLKREFEFLTNLFDFRADMIAALYKVRWQIELLFKQLKQNFPLKYFLGDNENAIKIQIYCALIVNLLMTVVQKRVKRKWSFSNLVSFCKIHLFNYIHLLRFLENPERDWRKNENKVEQMTLF
jgi:hypothetical protein